MKITTVGIDLAKNVFQVHGIDERGKAAVGDGRLHALRWSVKRFVGSEPGYSAARTGVFSMR
jgi:hypothetical protein